MDVLQARNRIAELRDGDRTTTVEELGEVWAALDTVRPEDMLGAWKGSEFVTGHPLEGQLQRANWYGKTFNSLLDVAPLMCRDADGELFSNIELGKGEASLWAVEFRGETTATMVYDGQPVFDHFKRIDESHLLGVMNGKGVVVNGAHYYFLLDRD